MDSRLGRQINELAGVLNDAGISFALIGGLALASHNVIRATQDIDLLVEAGDTDRINGLLLNLGYQCIHQSDDASNYLRDDERVDLLYATRPVARQLLLSAVGHETSFGILRVVSMEGLIGFKLQAIVNNPKRTQDIEDIRALLRNNKNGINMTEVRKYFQLYDRENLLDELLHEIS